MTSEETPVLLSEYDYELPEERIAQAPVEPRDAARLLVVPRDGTGLSHRVFRDLPDLLTPDDLLVVNETRVSAVRLFGQRKSGGDLEALLLRPALEWGPDTYAALVRPARRVRVGDTLDFAEAGLRAETLAVTPDGGRILRFTSDVGDVSERLDASGRVPLPPYITAPLENRERYQTVYSRVPGSAAAPTAGLHFTPELLERIQAMGVPIARVRLDVGLGTFRPVRVEDVREHEMHLESFAVPEETAEAVNRCTGRVVAVGTTTLRALESAAKIPAESSMHREEKGGTGRGRVVLSEGDTRLFIYPGFPFRAVDALITNFHQPHSTLLLLVAAFVGKEPMRQAYRTALAEGYRFLSFGDAMFAC